MIINLRDYYPFYTHDNFIEVEDIIAATLKAFELLDNAYRKRTNRHKAYYSLDRSDGIEKDIMLIILTPPEIYEKQVTNQELYAVLNSISDKQAKRIYAHYFLGLSKYAIAKAEGVAESSIRQSIRSGLMQMGKFLNKSMIFF